MLGGQGFKACSLDEVLDVPAPHPVTYTYDFKISVALGNTSMVYLH